jgi:hypothetical protein
LDSVGQVVFLELLHALPEKMVDQLAKEQQSAK